MPKKSKTGQGPLSPRTEVSAGEPGWDSIPLVGLPAEATAPVQEESSEPPGISDELRQAVLAVLRDSLRITVASGGFVAPNDRILTLLLDGEKIAQCTFDVCQTDEYGG